MLRAIPTFFLVFLLCISFGCKQQKPGKNGILTVNEMKVVMWDIIQVDEFAAVYLRKDSLLNIPKESAVMYEKVFALHKVSGKQFFDSFDFYKKHPEHFRVLVDSLAVYGNRTRDSSVYKPKQPPPGKIQ
jgi:hypothetical protein